MNVSNYSVKFTNGAGDFDNPALLVTGKLDEGTLAARAHLSQGCLVLSRFHQFRDYVTKLTFIPEFFILQYHIKISTVEYGVWALLLQNLPLDLSYHGICRNEESIPWEKLIKISSDPGFPGSVINPRGSEALDTPGTTAQLFNTEDGKKAAIEPTVAYLIGRSGCQRHRLLCIPFPSLGHTLL